MMDRPEAINLLAGAIDLMVRQCRDIQNVAYEYEDPLTRQEAEDIAKRMQAVKEELKGIYYKLEQMDQT